MLRLDQATLKKHCDRLQELFPSEFLGVEHIGSTAVLGLGAKSNPRKSEYSRGTADDAAS